MDMLQKIQQMLKNYCIYRTASAQLCNSVYTCETRYTYDIDVFFTFDLPLFGNVFTFTVNGETNELLYPDEAYLS